LESDERDGKLEQIVNQLFNCRRGGRRIVRQILKGSDDSI
jgi:hypothetical protein